MADTFSSNREGLSLVMLWNCVCDYHMWPIYLIGLSWTIPNVRPCKCDFAEPY